IYEKISVNKTQALSNLSLNSYQFLDPFYQRIQFRLLAKIDGLSNIVRLFSFMRVERGIRSFLLKCQIHINLQNCFILSIFTEYSNQPGAAVSGGQCRKG